MHARHLEESGARSLLKVKFVNQLGYGWIIDDLTNDRLFNVVRVNVNFEHNEILRPGNRTEHSQWVVQCARRRINAYVHVGYAIEQGGWHIEDQIWRIELGLPGQYAIECEPTSHVFVHEEPLRRVRDACAADILILDLSLHGIFDATDLFRPSGAWIPGSLECMYRPSGSNPWIPRSLDPCIKEAPKNWTSK